MRALRINTPLSIYDFVWPHAEYSSQSNLITFVHDLIAKLLPNISELVTPY